jgi:hypothetical protein
MMKNIDENNLSYLTGILVLLIFSTYFISIILYGRPGVAEPFIIVGAGVLLCVLILYHEKRYPAKKVAIAIGVGVGISLLFLVLAVLIGTSLINGLNPPLPAESILGSLEYNRSITLEVPLPVSPATVPLYRVVSVQKFSSGTGTALTVKKHIPSIEEAPGLAEKALGVYGGLPADAVLEKTEQVFMKKYNLKTGTVEEQYPQYTQVIYCQYVNDSLVVNSEISVSLGENGELLDISKDWSTLEYTGEIPVISADEAFEKLNRQDLLIPLQCSILDYHITRVEFGYHIETHPPDTSAQPTRPNICTPVWIFYGVKPGTDPEPFPLMVDATINVFIACVGNTSPDVCASRQPVATPAGCWQKIDPVIDHRVGEVFTINGTTNCRPGDRITVEIVSVSSGQSSRDFVEGDVEVRQLSTSAHGWSVTINASSFNPGQKIVSACGVGICGFQTFNLTE